LKKSFIDLVGKTPTGYALKGTFQIYDTHGVHPSMLTLLFDKLIKKYNLSFTLIPAWDDFVINAMKTGWSKRKIIAELSDCDLPIQKVEILVNNLWRNYGNCSCNA
jgi:hypothetical protein